MRKRTGWILSGVLWLLAAAFVYLVRTVDVAPIGPEGTSVGLSRLNGEVSAAVGMNMLWYTVTEMLGYASLLVAAFFAGMGIVQLIRRRSLKKVDSSILALGGLYALTAALYVLFEKVVINYRPVIMPGSEHVEASFPSSHTMLACVILGSAGMLAGRYIRKRGLQLTIQILCGILIFAMVCGRMISGVHWFTDIVGALLFSGALLTLYSVTGGRRKQRRSRTVRPK